MFKKKNQAMARDTIRIMEQRKVTEINTNAKTPKECEKCISHPDLTMKKGFAGNRKYIIFPYFNCTHGRLGLNVHLTMAHIKLEIRVSQNHKRPKVKGRQKKKQTNKQ